MASEKSPDTGESGVAILPSMSVALPSGTSPAETFRLRLQALLTANNLSARALALECGLDAGRLKFYLAGDAKRPPPIDVLTLISRRLRVSVDDLTGVATLGYVESDGLPEGGPAAFPPHDVVAPGVKMTAIVEVLRPKSGPLAGAEPRARWLMPADVVGGMTAAGESDLVIFTNAGDAMEPLVTPGAKLLVDLTDLAPSPPGMFVFHDGLSFRVMRAEYIPGSKPAKVRFLPANPAYASFEMPLAEAGIQGRVVGRWAPT